MIFHLRSSASSADNSPILVERGPQGVGHDMKPIILITAGKQNPGTPRGEVQMVTSGCDVDYVESVVRAGGAPVILPCLADREAIDAAVQAAAGVLLTGGGD